MRNTFFTCLFIGFSLIVSAQPFSYHTNTLPVTSPNVAQIGHFIDNPVSVSSGTLAISVPIFTLEKAGMVMPVSLDYHGGGIRVQQQATSVGLGWSLNAGGMISRTIKGIPDEHHTGYGGVKPNPPITFDPNALFQTSEAAFFMNMLNNHVDGQHDVFSFSFPGYSGHFIIRNGIVECIPKQDLKILFNNSTNLYNTQVGTTILNRLTNFLVITPDGTRYEFGKVGAQEEIDYMYGTSTVSLRLGNLRVPSAWHLVKVSTSDLKFSFNLNYAAETFSVLTYSSSSQTRMTSITPGFWPSVPNANCGSTMVSPRSQVWMDYGVRRLTGITSSDYAISFEYSTLREDLHTAGSSAARALASITVNSLGSSVMCKKYVLTSDYFKTTPNSTQWAEKRLRLRSVQETTCDGLTSTPAWQFDYTTDFVPSFYSTGQDFWGFYNGVQTNSNAFMFPSHSPDGQNLDAEFSSTQGANRFPNPNNVGVAMLRKIQFPAGGAEEYVYEINQYNNGTDQDSRINYKTTYSSLLSSDTSRGHFLFLTAVQLQEMRCKIVALGLSGDKSKHELRFRQLKSDSTVTIAFNIGALNQEFLFKEVFDFFRADEMYELTLESDSLLLLEFSLSTLNGNRFGPGVRIAERKIYKSPTELINTINYTYNIENERGSGILGQLPAYYSSVSTYAWEQCEEENFSLDASFKIRSEDSYIPLATFDNRLIYYTRVVEQFGSGGKKVNVFYPPSCCPSMGIPGANYPSVEPNKQLIAGKLLSEELFDDGGVLINKQEFHWEEEYSLLTYDILSAILAIPYTYQGPRANCSTSCSITLSFKYTYTPIHTGIAVLKSKRSTNYNVDNLVTYTYPTDAGINGVPILPIKESMQNSDGAIIEKEIFYTVGHSNSSISNFFNNLNLKHEIWREVVRHNGSVIGGFEKEYGFFHITTGQLQSTLNPFTSFVRLRKSFAIHGFSAASGFERTEKFAIQAYNSLGLPGTITQPGWLPEIFTYNSFGHLTGVTYGQLTKNYFYYGNTGILSRAVNERSQPVWYDYDALGRLQKKWELPTAHWTVKSSCASTQTYTYTYSDLGTVGINKIQTLTNIQSTNANPNAAASTQSTITHIQYVDGLGRILQNNIKALSSSDRDVIDFMKYDGLGRITEQFKPIQSLHSDGRFVPNFSPGQVKKTFSYESSPEGQLISESDFNWYPTQVQYYSNGSVIHIDGIFYQPNTLLITQQADANGVIKKSYSDKLGREVQVEIVRNVSSGEIAMTRFIYNARNQLIKVIPPGANSSDAELIYLYEYDNKGRRTRSKVPGKAWEDYTYHPSKEELVLTVSNNRLTSRGVWYVYKYDDFGNVIQEGECPLNTFGQNGTPLNPVFSLVHVSRTFGSAQHNKNLLTQESRLILESQGPDYIVVSYSYDNHGRVVAETSNTPLTILDHTSRNIQYFYDWQNRITGTLSTLNLGTGTFVMNKTQEYDEKGNPSTYKLSLNGQDVSEVLNGFNFRNELVSIALGKTGSSQLQKLDLAYTNQGWLRSLNDNEVLPIAESFNRMGDNSSILELCPSQNQGLTFLPTSAINAENDLFHYRLSYDLRNMALGTGQQEKTGNISQALWQVKGRPSQFYNYNYDFLSRLTLASYGEVLRMDKNQNPVYHNSNVFNEQLTYGSRGNILRLQRWGMQFTEEGNCFESQKIDDLFYTYTTRTNQLNSINDQTGQVQGWADLAGVGQSASYQYNLDGDLIYDPYKGISSDFNARGLAFNMSSSLTSGNIRMEYDASGELQIKETIENGTQLKEFYIDDYVFESIDGGDVRFKDLYFEYGRVKENLLKEGFIAHYKLTDHLGNTRLVFADLDGNGTIEQNGSQNEVLYEEHYYPFGMSFGNVLWRTPEGESFKPNFNGKEKVTALNLEQLLFGARNYDPAVGRWWSVDALADEPEQIDKSPYAYTWNNPINLTDPDGNCPRCLKTLAKTVVKSAAKGKLDLGDVYDLVDAGATLIDPNSSALDKSLALFDIVSPVSSKELKAGAKMLGLADGANDVSKTAKKTYQTYFKDPIDPKDGTYSGKTSGTGTPRENVANRDKKHHKNKTHGPARLDKSSSNPDAITGREQQNIDNSGGARSKGGTSGNQRNSVDPKKKERVQRTQQAAKREFGN